MIGSPLARTNRAAIARSQSIDQQLDEEKEKRKREIQLLILGSAGTGKSTFIKQLKIHHGNGFTVEERSQMVPLVLDNISEAILSLLNHMDLLGIQLENDSVKEMAKQLLESFVCALPSSTCGTSCGSSCVSSCGTSFALVDRLWNSSAVQHCFAQREAFDMETADSHFLENYDRITSPGYIPTVTDVLHIRKPTLGIQEHFFTIDQHVYRVIDVAGQRSHRKKWIHLFDCVTAILFFTSLSSFCEKMDEDPETNSLYDSLQLFQEVVSNKFLTRTEFILFLNKKDLFGKRLKRHKLSSCLLGYRGTNDEDSCSEFIRDQFLSAAKKAPDRDDREVYVQLSCTIDVDSMRDIISHTTRLILDLNLKSAKTV